jgi:hypothetical protein
MDAATAVSSRVKLNISAISKGSAVRWMMARWRPPKTRGPPKRRLLTRHVPWLLLRAPDVLKEDERADLERVMAVDAWLDAGYKLVRRFRVALHELDVTAFKPWLLDAAASDLKPFRAFGRRYDRRPGGDHERFSVSVEYRARRGPHHQSEADQKGRIRTGEAATPPGSHPRSKLSSRHSVRAGSARPTFTGFAGEPESHR